LRSRPFTRKEGRNPYSKRGVGGNRHRKRKGRQSRGSGQTVVCAGSSGGMRLQKRGSQVGVVKTSMDRLCRETRIRTVQMGNTVLSKKGVGVNDNRQRLGRSGLGKMFFLETAEGTHWKGPDFFTRRGAHIQQRREKV